WENSNVKQLLGVGGGLSQSIGFITSQYLSIEGINFDHPHWILHEWSDEYYLTLLKNCYKALQKDGKITVVKVIVKDEMETMTFPRAISLADLGMMTQCPGGKERSKREFEALAKGVGFSGIDFTYHVCGYWVMEFYL
ncbi:Caffeic acid 3-O-methyltransferase, partial [Bienertia sinuspersici]